MEVWKDEDCEEQERVEREAEEGVRDARMRAEEERKRKAEEMRRRMDAAAAQKSSHSKLTLDPLRHMQKTPTARPAPIVSAVPTPLVAPSASRPPVKSLGAGAGLVMALPVVRGRPPLGGTRDRPAPAGASAARTAKESSHLPVFNDFVMRSLLVHRQRSSGYHCC